MRPGDAGCRCSYSNVVGSGCGSSGSVLAESAEAGGFVARQPADQQEPCMPARGCSRRLARCVLLLASAVMFWHDHGLHVPLAAALVPAGRHEQLQQGSP